MANKIPFPQRQTTEKKWLAEEWRRLASIDKPRPRRVLRVCEIYDRTIMAV